MFGNIWNFLKRHKRKFMFSGVVIGGVYMLSKYAIKKLQEFQDDEAEECLAHARRQHHFDSNQRTCNMTVLSMLPSLRERVLKLLDSEVLTSQLKDKPANKMEIWEELKILSFSRCILAVYSISILIVFLRVQLNILGGYMYLDSLGHTEGVAPPERSKATPDIQQRYLAMVQYLLEHGLKEIAKLIQQTVNLHLSEVPLKQQMSLSDIQNLIAMVRKQVEVNHDNGYAATSTKSSLISFILPPDELSSQACGMTYTEITLQELATETREMLESDDFQCVLTSCFDAGFSRTVDKLAEYFKSLPGEDEIVLNVNHLSMPLAKVIPIMNGLVHIILADAPNTFVQDLLVKEQVKDFAANVYEAFSQPPAEQSPG